MTTAPPEPKPARRGRWLAVAVVVALLALTTWDAVRNSDRSSPAALRRAAFDGDEATVRRLVAAHPKWIDKPGSAGEHSSSMDSLYKKMEKWLRKADSEFDRDYSGDHFRGLESSGATPLVHALIKNNTGTTLFLIEKGANVRARLANGLSLVPNVIMDGETNVLLALEQHGASLDDSSFYSVGGAMHYAVFAKRPDMLLFFIARGRSVNVKNRVGNTPLHIAVERGRLDLVQVLVTNGADLTLVTPRGQTVLDAARYRVSLASSSNAVAVAAWLEAFAATNQPLGKPAP